MKTISLPPRPPLPFQSVRSSRDLSLVAFAGALLAAFALHAGAFVPRLGPATPPEAPRPEQAPARQEPAFVAARRAPAEVPRRAEAEPVRAATVAPAPCRTPRG